MNEICRVSADELRHDRESNKAPDYSPTYPQAVQNRYERLAKDRAWVMDYAGDVLFDNCEILQQAALSENESDIQQAGVELVKAVIKVLRNKAKDDIGEPWEDPKPTPSRSPNPINVNATFDKIFKGETT